MLEVKADALEASFEALERQDEDVAQLREEMAQLRARIDAQANAAGRPALHEGMLVTDQTDRYKLPFILPGQAQKELAHNEALAALDALLHPAIEEAPLAAPPDAPQLGVAWIVGAGAGGAWAGKEDQLAVWTDGGWRFFLPTGGMSVWNRANGHWIHWSGTSWSRGEQPATMLVIGGKKVVGERQPEVPSPSGGTIIDAEARAAIEAIIATLKSHGLTD